MIRRTALAALLGVALSGCPATTGQGNGTPGPGPGPGPEGNGGPSATALTAEQIEEVERTMRIGQDALNRCFTDEMERTKNKKLAGKVMFKILIGTNKAAEQVQIGENTLNGPEFQSCLIREIKSLEFPSIRTATWYTRALEFSPQY
jgi:hypothetical protein